MNARTVALCTAEEQKFFAKYGTDAQVIFIRQAPILLAGMSAGNVQIAATGGTSALLGASGGMDLKVVASLNGRVTYDLVAAANIKSVKELRGKRFGLQDTAARYGWPSCSGSSIWEWTRSISIFSSSEIRRSWRRR
jgi:ABC-type nitrate/sulfonate/bicarbonate transport system substrate-binding protein